ncbi:MAG: hypothetical protein A3F12_07255 [Gammaproteobacteria bacterium RIFCSPHIGHO2_12_FULL_38_14]|nr:MAG: hypothetical protein A3F12_07255 [Gammaproteobacteria bacterium RIFCSPHIGHO2_12_FULL_38_14]
METRYDLEARLKELFGKKFLSSENSNLEDQISTWRSNIAIRDSYIVYPMQKMNLDKNKYDESNDYFSVEIKVGNPVIWEYHKVYEYGMDKAGNIYNVNDLNRSGINDLKDEIQKNINKKIEQKKEEETVTYQYFFTTKNGQYHLDAFLQLIQKTIKCKKSIGQNPKKHEALVNLEQTYKEFSITMQDKQSSRMNLPEVVTGHYKKMIESLMQVRNISYRLLHQGKEKESHSKENGHFFSQALNLIGGIFPPVHSNTLDAADNALNKAIILSKGIREINKIKKHEEQVGQAYQLKKGKK